MYLPTLKFYFISFLLEKITFILLFATLSSLATSGCLEVHRWGLDWPWIPILVFICPMQVLWPSGPRFWAVVKHRNCIIYHGLLRICEFERLFYQCDIQLHTKLRSLRQYYPGTNFQTLRAWFLPKCQESYLWVCHFSGRQRSHQKLWPVTKFYLHVNCAPNKVEIILCEEWKWAEPSNSLFFFFNQVRVKSFWAAGIKLFRDHSDSLHQPCSLSGLWKGGQLQEAGDSGTIRDQESLLSNVPNLGDRVYYLNRSSITFNGQNPES